MSPIPSLTTKPAATLLEDLCGSPAVPVEGDNPPAPTPQSVPPTGTMDQGDS